MNQALINILCIFILTILFLYIFINPNTQLLGKNVWYDPQRLFAYELDGLQTSQQVFDIYTLSHITHGILFYFILYYFNFSNTWIVYISVGLEWLWEIIENTPYIVSKYRSNSAYKNYKGDSIANILGDKIGTILGVFLAMESPSIAIMYAVISEIMLYPYKANLLYLTISAFF